MRVLLVIYDNESYIHWFPQGMAYIASVLREAGHEVVIYNQDKEHYPPGHLTAYLDENRFDVVGLGVIAGYWQYRKLQEISEAVNRSHRRPFYVLGGHGPTPEPEYFIGLTGADAVVMGEGERTIVELLEAVSRKDPLSDIKGIAYADGDEIKVNERRPVIEDVDSIPFPAYDLFPMEYYRLVRKPHTRNTDFAMSMISGRGCPFKCTFCYRMDEGFRPRGNENIIDEMMLLKKDYGITYIDFYDELLMSSVDRTASLCKDFIKKGIDMRWMCQGRLNFAEPSLLKLMKKAGCVFINYGIESLDNRVLRNIRKGLTDKIIISGIEATLEAGISPGLNIMFGNKGDSRESIKKSVDFLLKYDDGAQVRTIRPVTPYPGTAIYYEAIEKGLLGGVADFYENKHVNSDLLSVNFTDMSDDEVYDCLRQANTELLENYNSNRIKSIKKEINKLYGEKDADFRGFRHS
jgi:radical SAM superfamily enzyme YgiQ (UPF0313 family)